MAITRTAIVDDNGTGMTGTALNNAWKQELYDQIDAADAGGTTQTTTSTGTQNDFAITAGTNVLRLNNATLLTINGLAAGVDGQRVEIVSVGAGQVDLANQAAGSTAANRLINGVTGTRSLAAGVGTATVVYDATAARWRVTAHEQGAWITPAYAAGDFTAQGAMTWTVDSADVEVYRYWLKGRALVVNWVLRTTSVGGTLNKTLYLKVPGGFSVANQATAGMMYNDNGAGYLFSAAWCTSALATQIQLFTAGFGTINWSASTNLTHVYGQITIEVT